MTLYSAIWRKGPLYYQSYRCYIRDSNQKVALKFLHNSQNSIESVINEVRKYSTKNDKFLILYGISQNSDTNSYILVQNEIVLEWIPYNQFSEIKEEGKTDSITVYSAIWRDGPLYYQHDTRDSNKEVALNYLHNSQNSIESVINKAKKCSTKNEEFLALYGISQNPNTNDYILVFNSKSFKKYCVICNEIYTDIQYKWCKPCKFMGWKSENDEIFDLLIQLKINEPSDTRFEWIPYNQFDKIRNIGEGHFVTVYSAIWGYEVALLCYNNSQKLLDKVKEFDSNFKIYGISQNSDKKDYILVLQKEYCMEYGKKYCKNCGVKFTQTRYMWCKLCINIFIKWTIENEKFVDLIQEMQLRINSCFNIVFEWVPYDQFNYIKKIGKGGFATVYSAIWKDGPLKYDDKEKIYTRVSNKKIALKCLNNSQNLTDKFLNEVKEYSINKKSDILNVYGISQNPNTKNFVIVLEYAEGGSYCNWINNNYKDFDWKNKIQTLIYIIEGLKRIHRKQKVHHDLHPGNILFLTKSLNTFNRKSLFISDMGLCEDVNNTSEIKSYGVISYMAPEVLRSKAYTQAADIYSFGMIMYFTATGKQPFVNCAHDEFLVLDIVRDGIRPEINELEIPKCYTDLMKRCWDSNPDNRPNATEIHKLIKSFFNIYNLYKKGESNAIEIRKQFIKAETYRKSHFSIFKKYKQHPQANYTSQLLTNFFMKDTQKSEYLSCAIPD
ncbi:unnamed protein product [Rhizophagus irregularis]|nr:unnamed protein product [Rhizophagus irregularis]